MELCMNHPCLMDSHVGGQRSIQRPEEFLVSVGPVKVERGNLSCRVNAGIGSPGHKDRASRPAQLAQGFFKLTLYRSALRLPLASEKVRAVVGKSQLVTCHCSVVSDQYSVVSHCLLKTAY
jgi:hypothetical protein